VRRILILTTVLIVYGSLYPWRFEFAGPARNPLLVLLNSWPSVWDRFAFRDAIINLLLYLPFGAAALCAMSRRFPRGFRIASVLVGGMALSCAMELLQVYLPGRVCSLFDVLCNTAGAGTGAALALTIDIPQWNRQGNHPMQPGPLLLLSAFVSYQLYPFFPVVSLHRLQIAVEQLTANFSPIEVWCCGAEWFTAMLVAGLAIRRLPPPVLLLCLPIRLVVVERTEALHEVLGGVLAVVAWLAVRDRRRLRIALWSMASALLLRELAPFHFSSSAAPFHWIPFGPTFESERQTAVVILIHKAFDYGASVWLLTENGISYARSGAIVAIGLVLLEAVQCYLPGRTPETTDAVLASLMTLILWILENFSRRRGLA